MQVWQHSLQGKRNYQEDRLLVQQDQDLFLVVDGMGGHANGNLAAESVVNHIAALDTINEQLIQAAFKACDLECSSHRDGRGACATALLLNNGKATCFQVGDTRCYLFSNKGNQQITVDQAGALGGITNFFGGAHFRMTLNSKTTYSFNYQEGDTILLATDGAFLRSNPNSYWNAPADELKTIIDQALSEGLDPAEVLCGTAVHLGSNDNCTCIIIKI